MAWVKIDTGFARHPKLLALNERTRWVHVSAMCFCAEHETNGRISRRDLAAFSARNSHVSALIQAGLWDEIDAENGVWQIHDWTDYNMEAERSKELRKNRARRQKEFRERKKAHRSGTDPDGGGDAPRNAPRDASRNAERDALTLTRAHGTRPDPTRPDPPTGVGERVGFTGDGNQPDVDAPSSAAAGPPPALISDEQIAGVVAIATARPGFDGPDPDPARQSERELLQREIDARRRRREEATA